ncbi:MAG: hypothetical protein HOW73_26780 [Polyangiaceae bacterium]|nr:hypothetical protein [Polyangiaceae bacterium]
MRSRRARLDPSVDTVRIHRVPKPIGWIADATHLDTIRRLMGPTDHFAFLESDHALMRLRPFELV